jgi:cytochrome c553
MKLFTTTLTVITLFAASAYAQESPAGDAAAGKALWAGEHCSFCHGNNGEGGFGPDLAGRALTLPQFVKAVRQPWGMMPQFGESQLSDSELANIRAYLSTLPKPTQLGKWHWGLPPAGAPLGQTLQISVGCGQCHEPELGMPRRQLGAVAKDATFEYFAKVIWDHNAKYPKGNMGNFSRERVSEPVLREIYNFMKSLGLRVPMSGAINAEGAGKYSVTLSNAGMPGKGLDAEVLTVQVMLPQGFKVGKTDGAGYKGVKQSKARQFALDGSGRIKEWDADAMIWELPKLAAGEKTVVSFTLTGNGTPDPTAFDGSLLLWEKPTTRVGMPHLEYRDHRIPEIGDAAQIRSPRP